MLNLHPAFMLNAHPLVVHYPIALLTAAFVLEALFLLFRRDSLRHAATASLVLGTLCGVVAVATGLVAGASVPHPETAHDIMQTHETLALTSFGLASMLSVWRLWLWRKTEKLHFVFPILMLAMALIITYTAHLGGRMVFGYGVGGTAVEMPAEDHHHGP